MSDLISREELKKTVKRMESLPWGDEEGNRVEFKWSSELVEHLIDKAPSAEKTGKWTIETIGEIPRRDSPIYEPIYKCSCCGMTTESYVRFEEPIMPEDADFPNFCPKCGAKMEVEE